MRIVIYRYQNNDFVRIGTTENAVDITYNIDLTAISGFEFTMPMGAKYALDIIDDDFVEINGEFWGRVEGRDFDYVVGAVTFTGFDLKSLLLYRQIVPVDYTSTDGTAGYMTVNGSTETCIKYLWEKNAQAPPQQHRAYPGMAILPDKHLGNPADKYMARFKDLHTATQELCDAEKLGIIAWVDLDHNWVCFDVYQGDDRTAEQTTNARAIFEIDRRNLASLEYSTDKTDFRNAFYTTKNGAEFEDEALTLLYYRGDETASGFDRREAHLSVSVDTPTAGQEYDEMKRMAVLEMKNSEISDGFSCQLAPQSGYDKLWVVGDMVTIRHKPSGLIADVQITGVTINASENNLSYVAKFGNQKPKFIQLGKKIVKV